MKPGFVSISGSALPCVGARERARPDHRVKAKFSTCQQRAAWFWDTPPPSCDTRRGGNRQFFTRLLAA